MTEGRAGAERERETLALRKGGREGVTPSLPHNTVCTADCTEVYIIIMWISQTKMYWVGEKTQLDLNQGLVSFTTSP